METMRSTSLALAVLLIPGLVRAQDALPGPIRATVLSGTISADGASLKTPTGAVALGFQGAVGDLVKAHAGSKLTLSADGTSWALQRSADLVVDKGFGDPVTLKGKLPAALVFKPLDVVAPPSGGKLVVMGLGLAAEMGIVKDLPDSGEYVGSDAHWFVDAEACFGAAPAPAPASKNVTGEVVVEGDKVSLKTSDGSIPLFGQPFMINTAAGVFSRFKGQTATVVDDGSRPLGTPTGIGVIARSDAKYPEILTVPPGGLPTSVGKVAPGSTLNLTGVTTDDQPYLIIQHGATSDDTALADPCVVFGPAGPAAPATQRLKGIVAEGRAISSGNDVHMIGNQNDPYAAFLSNYDNYKIDASGTLAADGSFTVKSLFCVIGGPAYSSTDASGTKIATLAPGTEVQVLATGDDDLNRGLVKVSFGGKTGFTSGGTVLGQPGATPIVVAPEPARNGGRGLDGALDQATGGNVAPKPPGR
jgi:hypothetical protein